MVIAANGTMVYVSGGHGQRQQVRSSGVDRAGTRNRSPRPCGRIRFHASLRTAARIAVDIRDQGETSGSGISRGRRGRAADLRSIRRHISHVVAGRPRVIFRVRSLGRGGTCWQLADGTGAADAHRSVSQRSRGLYAGRGTGHPRGTHPHGIRCDVDAPWSAAPCAAAAPHVVQ